MAHALIHMSFLPSPIRTFARLLLRAHHAMQCFFTTPRDVLMATSFGVATTDRPLVDFEEIPVVIAV